MADLPHFQNPFTRASGKVCVVEQDSREHVLSCLSVIASCPTGFREDRPEFGWPFPEFRNFPLETGPLESALTQFEPRASTNAVEYGDLVDDTIRNIRVEVDSG